MTIDCPACGKKNKLEDGICCRCACNLEKLAAIVRMAASFRDEAAVCLRAADGVGALARARASWELRHSVEAARLAFLASLMNHDFAAASRWYVMGVGADSVCPRDREGSAFARNWFARVEAAASDLTDLA